MRGLMGAAPGVGSTARSGAEGSFSMQVPTGRHRVVVRHLDYTPRSAVIEVAQGVTERNFQLTPMAVIEGVVLADATDAPVPGAIVSIARERVMKSWEKAYIGRKEKPRQYRQLWNQQINAGARRLNTNYSELKHHSHLANVQVNRKVLAELAGHEPYSFAAIVETANRWGAHEKALRQQQQK